MNTLYKLFASCIFIMGAMALVYSKKPPVKRKVTTPHPIAIGAPVAHPHKKIQVAVLLDVSNSMDGLIGQAKALSLAVRNNRTENRFSGLLALLKAFCP